MRWVFRISIALVLLLSVLWVGGRLYSDYWMREAGEAVDSAVAAIADGETPANVGFDKSFDVTELSEALSAGSRIVGFDNIPFGFRDYEVMIRVSNGDQYNFDAFHRNGAWALTCCNHWEAAELP